MENNRNLFKEAIADAKAVKEVSIANAKAALEEVITPRLKSMFEQKLTEMEEEDDKQEEGYKMKEDSTLEEEFNLEELLAELDEVEGEEANEEEVTETVNESEEVTEEETHEEKVYEEEETEEEEAEEADEDKADDSEVDIDFDNMTEDDLRAFIEEVVDEMIDAEELALSDEAEEAEEEMEDEDVEIDIEDEMEDIELEDEVEDLEEVSNQMGASAAGGAAELEKIIEKLAVGTSAGMAKGMRESDSEELAEATDTIKILQTELNEVNLLNSKLLYVNKILKGSTLKESQKVKVITAFDKAETVKEVKLVYETLKESISKAPTKVATKKLVRESKNFASSTINGASPNTKPVMEVDPMIARMKKLAGLT